MPSHYVVSKRSDGWVIAVDGSLLLICERRKDAMRAVREATVRSAAPAGSADPNCHAQPQTEAHDSAKRILAAAG